MISQLLSYIKSIVRLISRKNIAGFPFNLSPFQGRPGFLGVEYIVVFNFRYTVFLCSKLGIQYSLTTNLGCGGGFLKLVLHDF